MKHQQRDSQSSELQSHWLTVIRYMVAACQGDQLAAQHMRQLIDRLANQPNWTPLMKALLAIIDGERNEHSVLQDLSKSDAYIASKILYELNLADLRQSSPGAEIMVSQRANRSAEVDISLLDYLIAWTDACRPNTAVEQRRSLTDMARLIAELDSAPQELKLFASMLQGLPYGVCELDLSMLDRDFHTFVIGIMSRWFARSPQNEVV